VVIGPQLSCLIACAIEATSMKTAIATNTTTASGGSRLKRVPRVFIWFSFLQRLI
jgi:hypothetical protein